MKKKVFTNIAKLVKEARLKKGLSQTELSSLLGYKNGQFISNVERGLCSVPVEKMGVLMTVTGVDGISIQKALVEDLNLSIKPFISQ